MTHRGNRSQTGQEHQAIRRLTLLQHRLSINYIFTYSPLDPERAEIANRLPVGSVLAYISQAFGTVITGAVPELEQGLVLVDSRGSGVCQTVNWNRK